MDNNFEVNFAKILLTCKFAYACTYVKMDKAFHLSIIIISARFEEIDWGLGIMYPFTYSYLMTQAVHHLHNDAALQRSRQ